MKVLGPYTEHMRKKYISVAFLDVYFLKVPNGLETHCNAYSIKSHIFNLVLTAYMIRH